MPYLDARFLTMIEEVCRGDERGSDQRGEFGGAAYVITLSVRYGRRGHWEAERTLRRLE